MSNNGIWVLLHEMAETLDFASLAVRLGNPRTIDRLAAELDRNVRQLAERDSEVRQGARSATLPNRPAGI